jgi:hypothetical protein
MWLANVAGVLGLALGLQHGYDLIIVYAVVGTTAVLLSLRGPHRVAPLALATCMCAWSVPAAAYLVYITRASPIWRETLAQYGNADVYTPTPPHLLILLGLPLILVLVGVVLRARGGSLPNACAWPSRVSPSELLLGVWLVVGFGLLYVPTDFQVKMLAGWQVPVAIFATRVLFTHVIPSLYRGRRRAPAWLAPSIAALFVLSVLPTNAYLLGWRIVDLSRHQYPYYLERDEITAMQWLDRDSTPSDVVLSSLTIGQYIPSESGNSVFVGHWANTVDFYTKQRAVERFFNDTTSQEFRRDLLDQFNVRYVFYSHSERALGGFDPDSSPSLVRVFTSGSASIYRVQQPEAAGLVAYAQE